MNTQNPIAENLRIEMVRRHISGEEMAAQMFISVSTFYKRLANPDNFTIGELKAIAKFLKMDLEKLLRRYT